MKRTIKILCVLSFITLSNYAQNVFPTTAASNVGIGTTAPTTRLQITSATTGTSGLRLTNLISTTASVATNGKALTVDPLGNVVLTPVLNSLPVTNNLFNSDGTLLANRNVTMNGKNLTFFPSTPFASFFINGTNGNVGLGTITPTTKLDVKGKINAIGGSFESSLGNGVVNPSLNPEILVLSAGAVVDAIGAKTLNLYDCPTSDVGVPAWVWFNIQNRNDVARFQFRAIENLETELNIFNKTQSSVFSVFNDGNDNVKVTLPKADSYLGIGTTSFTDGVDTFRLSVKGNIRAERVKVYTTWADFVFEKNYSLPTLEEVEKQISQNGHLKDIPSAKEVEKNGIELGEMNKLLLQKVEELTLYLIDMNKEIKELKNQLKK